MSTGAKRETSRLLVLAFALSLVGHWFQWRDIDASYTRIRELEGRPAKPDAALGTCVGAVLEARAAANHNARIVDACMRRLQQFEKAL